jgi:Holliday junction resolvase-like predicted endonuclease
MPKNGTLRLNNMAEYDALLNRFGPQNLAKLNNIVTHSLKTNNKHNNIICEADQIRFQSKKHREYYLLLKARQFNKEIKFFLREVPFDLIGHYENGRLIRHFVDFAICQNDDTYLFVEVKGRDLPEGKIKRLQTEQIYGIKILVV